MDEKGKPRWATGWPPRGGKAYMEDGMLTIELSEDDEDWLKFSNPELAQRELEEWGSLTGASPSAKGRDPLSPGLLLRARKARRTGG